MKKLFVIATLAVVLMGMLAVSVNATTADSVNEIYTIGSKYGMTENDKQQLQNFIDRNGVTEAQAAKLVEKAKEAEQVMTSAGKTKYSELTTAEKDKLKEIANSAASEVGVSLVFKSKSVEIWKDGKKVLVVTNNEGKLAYTGNTSNVVAIAVSSIAVVALAVIIVNKRIAAKAE